MIDRALARVLRRVGNGRERDILALGQVGERAQLSAHIGGAMTIDFAAHVGGDRVNGDQPHVACGSNHYLLQLFQVFVEEKYPLFIVLADLAQDKHAFAIGAGGDQARHDGLVRQSSAVSIITLPAGMPLQPSGHIPPVVT